MKDYPPPEKNPDCKCIKEGKNPFYCMTGHLTECHYPLECDEADCSHLPSYLDEGDFD